MLLTTEKQHIQGARALAPIKWLILWLGLMNGPGGAEARIIFESAHSYLIEASDRQERLNLRS